MPHIETSALATRLAIIGPSLAALAVPNATGLFDLCELVIGFGLRCRARKTTDQADGFFPTQVAGGISEPVSCSTKNLAD